MNGCTHKRLVITFGHGVCLDCDARLTADQCMTRIADAMSAHWEDRIAVNDLIESTPGVRV